MAKKKRLDAYLAETNRSESREKARREIIAGWVKVNGETIRKPAFMVRGEEEISVQRPGGIFVSRGGEKLDFALNRFQINLTGKIAADLGASTGGFTHCMLLRGAKLVYAVDVGYGQLDYRLREHPCVRVMERTHVNDLVPALFDSIVDFVVADLSFISLVKVFDAISSVFPAADYLFLIKPQFEALPGEHKKGVVKNADAHRQILMRVLSALATKGMIVRSLCPSPLMGPAGNIEFFTYGRFCAETGERGIIADMDISAVVDEAHRTFSEKNKK
jgi:23S rRNA (cytidine1920-2'-O)/16S rRNA (cytidine1409-2'-O)-methyltransferase